MNTAAILAHTTMLPVFLACMYWSANFATLCVFGAFAFAHAFSLLWAVNRRFAR